VTSPAGLTDINLVRLLSPLTPELNPLRATLPAEIFERGILIFKGLTARRLYKSFGVKGLTSDLRQVSICDGSEVK
jgi:hypothetical protein